MQAAIVPITGKLLDYPGLIVAFLFVVFGTVAYLLSNTRLFLILALVAVGTITTVYVGIFEPGQIGWGSDLHFRRDFGRDFGDGRSRHLDLAVPGGTGAIGVHRRRLRTIPIATRNGGATLSRSAFRTAANSTTCIAAGTTSGASGLYQGTRKAPARLARLLDAVVTSERVFLEVERLAVLADEPVGDEIRQTY